MCLPDHRLTNILVPGGGPPIRTPPRPEGSDISTPTIAPERLAISAECLAVDSRWTNPISVDNNWFGVALVAVGSVFHRVKDGHEMDGVTAAAVDEPAGDGGTSKCDCSNNCRSSCPW